MKFLSLIIALIMIFSLTACEKIDGSLDGAAAPFESGDSAEPIMPATEPAAPESEPEANVPAFTVTKAAVSAAAADTAEAVTNPADTIEAVTDPADTIEAVTCPATTEEEIPAAPVRENFCFPEEFYRRLEEIMARYSVNPSCNPELTPCGCEPEKELIAEDGSMVKEKILSIYYCDAESGYEIFINPGVHYPVASTAKAAFCVLVYRRIAAGKIDPEMILTYEKRHYFGGSGVIVQGDFGQQYSVLELLTLAITRSDNVAYEMLKDLVSWEDFEAFAIENGVTHTEDSRRYKQKICLESAKVYANILKDFLNSDNPYVDTMKADLLNTRNKMIRSSYPVYRKYGWTDYAFHDVAYIDAPHPYILAILSNMDEAEKSDYALFSELSYLFEEYAQAE